ncbi:polysaccharide deacetylase family protein [Aneurinibacillus terranovensis]|uniref:polysaccharide deacetylase family protein n=1 Tax=Aneurinibacillus terranovensis TaxID=278991 RepID=UPI0004121C7B|nr:polysaccharide deacetylase family protein [Aneurinibacillus terranovensis]
MILPQAPIYIDGQPVITTYYLQNGYLMVPALFFKYTGVFVDWNVENQSVVLKRNNMILTLPSGKKYADYYVKDMWQRDLLPTITTNFPDGTYIPLQYVSEKLGMTVSYHFKQSRTYIVTNTPPSSIPRIYYNGDPSKKRVALTFDDGPDNFYTPQILDILNDNGVTATFFVVGKQVKLFPQVLKRILQEGHEIGNHSWSHPELPKLTTTQVIQEVQKAELEIDSITGRKTVLFRPPFGLFTNADLRTIDDLGHQIIMWSVDTLDWQGISEEEILSIVKRDVSPGAIILQHALLTAPRILDGTVKALPGIIDYLRKRGYTFVTVHTLIEGD